MLNLKKHPPSISVYTHVSFRDRAMQQKNGLRTWGNEIGAGFMGDRAMPEKNGEGSTNSLVVPTINHRASNRTNPGS